MTQTLFIQREGQGPPMVLLHGWGTDHRIWGEFGEKLGTSFQLNKIDLPGFGESEHVHAYDLPEYAAKVLAVAPEKAVYVGWSMGGLVAGYIASHYPHRVDALICIASSPCFVSHSEWPGMSLSVLNNFHQLLKNDYVKSFQRFLAMQFLNCEQGRSITGELMRSMAFRKIPDQVSLQNSFNVIRNSDLRPEYAKLKCPQLHLLGSLDTIVPKQTSQALKELNPSAHVELLKKTAHMPFLSKTELCIELIGDFLDDTAL